MLYMKMSFFVGIFVAAPYILYQVWAFVAPGLYPHERRYAMPFIFFGTVFFLGGAAFGHFLLFPMTFEFLGSFGGGTCSSCPGSASTSRSTPGFSWRSALSSRRRSSSSSSRIGLVTPGFLLRKFKFAVLGAFIVAAVVTPTPDVVTQSALAVPMLALYLLGVVVAWLFGKKRRNDE